MGEKMSVLNGQCHCGQCCFEVSGEPQFQFNCYCTGCRQLNSSGHLSGMLFNTDEFSEADNTKHYSYPGGSGEPIQLHFCPNCATHLYAYPTSMPNKVVIRPNVLEHCDFKSQQNLFADGAFEWDKVEEE